MTFFAKRSHSNGADTGSSHLPAADTTAVQAVPPATNAPMGHMADGMLRKMLGIGISDLQGMADQAGEMLANFDRRLTALEAGQTEILARLTYIAARLGK
jgi:hypothetical protein